MPSDEAALNMIVSGEPVRSYLIGSMPSLQQTLPAHRFAALRCGVPRGLQVLSKPVFGQPDAVVVACTNHLQPRTGRCLQGSLRTSCIGHLVEQLKPGLGPFLTSAKQ